MNESIKTRKRKGGLTGSQHYAWRGVGELSKNYFTRYKRQAEGPRNLVFEVTIDFLWELFLKQNRRCALTGLPIQLPQTDKTLYNYTASLDRINSKFGYTESNVQWVHKAINHIKKNFPNDVFLEMCHLVANNCARPEGVNFDSRHKEIIDRSSEMPTGENHHRSKEYLIIDPEGKEFTIKGLEAFCRLNGFSKDCLSNAIRKGKKYKGYLITKKSDEPTTN